MKKKIDNGYVEIGDNEKYGKMFGKDDIIITELNVFIDGVWYSVEETYNGNILVPKKWGKGREKIWERRQEKITRSLNRV